MRNIFSAICTILMCFAWSMPAVADKTDYQETLGNVVFDIHGVSEHEDLMSFECSRKTLDVDAIAAKLFQSEYTKNEPDDVDKSYISTEGRYFEYTSTQAILSIYEQSSFSFVSNASLYEIPLAFKGKDILSSSNDDSELEFCTQLELLQGHSRRPGRARFQSLL